MRHLLFTLFVIGYLTGCTVTSQKEVVGVGSHGAPMWGAPIRKDAEN